MLFNGPELHGDLAAEAWIFKPLFVMHCSFVQGVQTVKGNRGEAGVFIVQQLQAAQAKLHLD